MKCTLVGSRFFGATVFEALRNDGTEIARVVAPAADDRLAKPPEWFLSAVRFAEKARTSPTARVLVHCLGGASRSPAVAYAILRAAGWSPVLDSRLR